MRKRVVKKNDDEEIESVERPAKEAGEDGVVRAQFLRWFSHRASGVNWKDMRISRFLRGQKSTMILEQLQSAEQLEIEISRKSPHT